MSVAESSTAAVAKLVTKPASNPAVISGTTILVVQTYRSLVLVYRGRMSDAASVIDEVLPRAQQVEDNPQVLPPALLAAAVVAQSSGEIDRARALLEELEELSRPLSYPRGFVAPSFAWDWTKLDVGLRITIIRKLDLTLEYAFHDITASRDIKHDEALATLRMVF